MKASHLTPEIELHTTGQQPHPMCNYEDFANEN